MRIVVADIGGTNARFALAEVEAGRVLELSHVVALKASDFAGLDQAWRAYGDAIGQSMPKAASLGVAAPVTDGPMRFINSHWTVHPASLSAALGIDRLTLLNDFGAMAHAADALGPEHSTHICGPDVQLPERGNISVIGPGTGLGVAILVRGASSITILETEGAHIHFAPLDAREERVCAALRQLYGRVSVERVVSGPGLGNIVRATGPADERDDAALWAAAIAGDAGMAEPLDLFLASFGAAVGDLSLAHGAFGVVLAGGLTNRIMPHLAASRFHARFCDKGRYRERMEAIPVKLITHPQPGLFGAAAAFAKEHAR